MIHQHIRNGWFSSADLGQVMKAIHETARTEPTRWLEHGIDCKYVQVRVDMRTGDFCIQNAFGDRLLNEEILRMFPSIESIETFGEQ